ncbi:Protein of unknown function [Bacillus mycoides]|nr:Protein of unknown function [Bacillus mycoides]
MEYSGMVSVWF